MDSRHITYFDNNATTRIAPEVVDAMLPFLRDYWGNPSAAYRFSNEVAKAVEASRGHIAQMINADPRDILFTSCGTESDNTAINSALRTQPGKRHIVTTSVEHSAIVKHVAQLKKQAVDITMLPVETDGSLDLGLLEQSIREDTALVSIMWANNETGVIFPIEEIAAICRMKGALFHTDAVQTPGKIKLDVQSTGVDMMSLSAHKLHAPKGIGILYVKPGTRFAPMVIGGSQERGRRGGTENVANIVAFGRAAELAVDTLDDENTRVRALRDRLEKTILETIPNTARNGSATDRLPNTSNIAFGGVEAEAILLLLDQENICASSGSACTTGSLEPSHVLTAMGLSPEWARGSVRFSLGIYNTEQEVDHVLDKLPKIINRLRAASPKEQSAAVSDSEAA